MCRNRGQQFGFKVGGLEFEGRYDPTVENELSLSQLLSYFRATEISQLDRSEFVPRKAEINTYFSHIKLTAEWPYYHSLWKWGWVDPAFDVFRQNVPLAIATHPLTVTVTSATGQYFQFMIVNLSATNFGFTIPAAAAGVPAGRALQWRGEYFPRSRSVPRNTGSQLITKATQWAGEPTRPQYIPDGEIKSFTVDEYRLQYVFGGIVGPQVQLTYHELKLVMDGIGDYFANTRSNRWAPFFGVVVVRNNNQPTFQVVLSEVNNLPPSTLLSSSSSNSSQPDGGNTTTFASS